MAVTYVGTRYAKRGGLPTLPWHTVAVPRAGRTNPVAQCGVEAAQNRMGYRQWYEIVDAIPEGGKGCRKCAVPRCIRCRSENVKVCEPDLCGPCYIADSYAEYE